MASPTKAQQMMIEDGLPAEIALLTEEERRADWKGVKLTKPKDLKVPQKDEDPATKALRKEMAKVEEQKRAERFARLKELKATTTKQAATSAEEHDMKKTTKKTAKKAPAKKAAKKTAPKAPAAAKPAKATPAPAPGERADGLRAGSKQAVMLDMVSKPEGATEQELCKALGWKKCRVTLRRVAEKVGAKLASEKVEGRGTVYKVAA